ncbi:hypothetical protein B0J18DRAFT_102683 [Chaetomium sp. MPI-SDFR-AT-0129]|nr:hypothetical protein B0J18DRAFT_102683 [Chaetomium sp. MPI-SDFR-AT-0129]
MKRHADPARAQTPRSLMSSSSFSSSSWSIVSASMSPPPSSSSSSSSDGVSGVSNSYSYSYEADAAAAAVPALLMFDDCNLPELLARDLVMSKDIFTSKAMTAGPPDMGLAAAAQDHPECGLVFQRPILPYREREIPRRPPSRINNTCLSYSPVPEEEESDLSSDDSFQHGEHPTKTTGFRGGVPTTTRSTCAAPPRSIPTTRRQSVAAAIPPARPVQGHCSPVFAAHHLTRPTSPVPSPSSSNREGSSHGTWFEDEPDSPSDNEPESSVVTARSSISESHHHVNMDYGDSSEMKKPSRERAASVREEFPEVNSMGNYYGTPSRPQTPAAGGPTRSHSKKPRIVDIPPVIAGPTRSSSLRWNRHGADSLSKSPDHEFLPSETVSRERHSATARSADLEFQEGSHHVDLPLLETANGRTVIDASSPPPIAFAHNGQAHEGSSSSPRRNENGNPDDDEENPDEDDDDDENTYTNIFASPPRRSLTNIHHRIDDTTNPPTPSARAPHVSHGIPLPPEVIESLRVSISCFPETMLLTSNLSVETIRAYSKKIKHRADLSRHLRNTDADSIYSFASSQQAKPAKRWNMGWWRSSSNHNQHHRSQQSDPFSRDTPSHSLGASNLPFPTAVRRGPPVWKPIKNVFPSAPDKLCDALYAHLLVYNYLTSLSPQPRNSTSTPTTTIPRSATTPAMASPFQPPLPTTTNITNTKLNPPRPPTPYFYPEQPHPHQHQQQQQPRHHSSRPRSADENPATAGLKIPQKAASLLGMGVADSHPDFPPFIGNRDFGSPQAAGPGAAARRGVLVRGRRPLQKEQQREQQLEKQRQGQEQRQNQATYHLSKDLPATPSRGSSNSNSTDSHTGHAGHAVVAGTGARSKNGGINNHYRHSNSTSTPAANVNAAAAAAAMRKELLAGLERCISLLISVMKHHGPHGSHPTGGNGTRMGKEYAESTSLFGSDSGYGLTGGGLGSLLGKKVKGALGGERERAKETGEKRLGIRTTKGRRRMRLLLGGC